MTWIKLKLPADREEQKQIHMMLRKEVLGLANAGILDSFVMTYHGSSFHLCLDIPTLTEYSLKALKDTNHMDRIIDIVQPYLSREASDLFDYFRDVVDGQAKELSQLQLTKVDVNIEGLATRLIENASRGCKAALNILSDNLTSNLNPLLLYDLIFEKCHPLNGGLWISDSAHFCFNSLGMDIFEEFAIRGCPVFSTIDEMAHKASKAIERLLNREGVSST